MNNQNKKIQIYVFGGLIGAVVGFIGAYLLDKSAAFEGEEFKVNIKKVTKTALGVVSLLWSLIEKK
jgi:gas vesicle protein